jgi:hypothetical protein
VLIGLFGFFGLFLLVQRLSYELVEIQVSSKFLVLTIERDMIMGIVIDLIQALQEMVDKILDLCDGETLNGGAPAGPNGAPGALGLG